jgi:peptide-methionine (S)-S-oxide reductase
MCRCFWGLELAYQRVPGVIKTSVGYTGGQMESPTYEEVCMGFTGHAEVVQVTYDPDQVCGGGGEGRGCKGGVEVGLNGYAEVVQVTYDPDQVCRRGGGGGVSRRSVALVDAEFLQATYDPHHVVWGAWGGAGEDGVWCRTLARGEVRGWRRCGRTSVDMQMRCTPLRTLIRCVEGWRGGGGGAEHTKWGNG